MGFEGDGVAVVSVKRLNERPGYLLRLWEMTGERRQVRLHGSGAVVACAWETDLHGDDTRRLDIHGDTIALDFGPNEVKTLRVVLGSSGGNLAPGWSPVDTAANDANPSHGGGAG